MTKTPQTFAAIAGQKAFWLCVPFLVVPALILFAFGEIKWALITFAVLPVALAIIRVGVFASKHRPDPRFYQIINHMTEDERRRFNKLTSIYGIPLVDMICFLCWLAHLAFF